jgi:NAD(P)H-dependent FMN reductase
MKILAFAAGNSRNSINRALVEHAAGQLKSGILPNADITFLDLNDYEMPIYSIDRENEGGIPAQAKDFFAHIGAADAVLVSFPEHNGFVTTAWKNIFDWMSRINAKVWQDKPIAMLAATPGGRAGANVLASQTLLAPHFGADLRGTLGVGKWREVWDEEAKRLTQPEDFAALDDVLGRLIAPSSAEAAV